MLKWAVTPRLHGEFFEQDGVRNGDDYELLTLQVILEQQRLPCLVRLINDDVNESNDNYCLLLCQTKDPYLLASNENERFSLPVSFDGKSLKNILAPISSLDSKIFFSHVCMTLSACIS
jgi:hypothetical protein